MSRRGPDWSGNLAAIGPRAGTYSRHSKLVNSLVMGGG
jgi:hypothetical protein